MEMIRVDTPPWNEMAASSDYTLFQSKPWIDFIAEAQNAKPVFTAVVDQNEQVGWFTGLVVRKFGLKILGSPFPGWTTSYMGFNLQPHVSRIAALSALFKFSKAQLRCAQVEVLDRYLTVEEVTAMGYRWRLFAGFEVDLSGSEGDLFNRFVPSCRRNIRKAEREGIIVQPANDSSFADDYYKQLQEVFALQKLKPTYSHGRICLLIKHLMPTGRLLLLRAFHPNGQCIATGIFPADNQRMYFWGGASSADSRIMRPNEAIQWHAMRYWKQRGVKLYDMGGGGEYKRKYGGRRISVPWIRHSHLPGLEMLRNIAQKLTSLRQRH